MNLFHAPWLRQPHERAGHYTFGDPRRRSGWRAARSAATGRDRHAAAAPCGECDGPPPPRRAGTHSR